jgi:hypothetical protein
VNTPGELSHPFLHRKQAACPLTCICCPLALPLRPIETPEGGTFALYSLVCRAAGFTAFGPTQPDLALRGSAGALSRLPPSLAAGHCWSFRTPRAGAALRAWYRRSAGARTALLVVVTAATAMVAGDGLLTPSISGEAGSARWLVKE